MLRSLIPTPAHTQSKRSMGSGEPVQTGRMLQMTDSVHPALNMFAEDYMASAKSDLWASTRGPNHSTSIWEPHQQLEMMDSGTPVRSRPTSINSTSSCFTVPLMVPTVTDMGLLSTVILESAEATVHAKRSRHTLSSPSSRRPRSTPISQCSLPRVGTSEYSTPACTPSSRPLSMTGASTASEWSSPSTPGYFGYRLTTARAPVILRSGRLFGASMQSAKEANYFSRIELNSHALDLPTVVCVAVQELERRAELHAENDTIGELNSFKSVPTRELDSLIDFFESRPTVEDCTLSQDDAQDVYELLLVYLESLPDPLLDNSTRTQLSDECLGQDQKFAVGDVVHNRVTAAQLLFLLLPTERKHLLIFVLYFVSSLRKTLVSRSTSNNADRQSDFDTVVVRVARAVNGHALALGNSSASAYFRRRKETSSVARRSLSLCASSSTDAETSGIEVFRWLLQHWDAISLGLLPLPQEAVCTVPVDRDLVGGRKTTLGNKDYNVAPLKSKEDVSRFPSPQHGWIKRQLSRSKQDAVTLAQPLARTANPSASMTSRHQSIPELSSSTHLKAEIQRHKRDASALRKEAAELRKDNKRLGAENVRLGNEHARLKGSSNRSVQEIKQLKADKTRLLKRVDVLEKAAREREFADRLTGRRLSGRQLQGAEQLRRQPEPSAIPDGGDESIPYLALEVAPRSRFSFSTTDVPATENLGRSGRRSRGTLRLAIGFGSRLRRRPSSDIDKT
ncbi:hypothetical protein BKA62DRAFT_314736 [Auriculariales sp. MPI-PUGE-AT-0066]|nr:hypothetical protein BKA62DRAFT_314736 [Auriculariales sp. MPI-PUGE-AT-0066]